MGDLVAPPSTVEKLLFDAPTGDVSRPSEPDVSVTVSDEPARRRRSSGFFGFGPPQNKKKLEPLPEKKKWRRKEPLTPMELASASYAQRFSSDNEARLKVVLADGSPDFRVDAAFNDEVLKDVFEALQDETPTKQVIKHLSSKLRRDPRLPRAPRAWTKTHLRLAKAFRTKLTAAMLRSAIFHYQQALRGLDFVENPARSRVEVDMAQSFGLLSDALAQEGKLSRARESATNQMEMAEVAIIHVDGGKDNSVFRSAKEELATALLRCSAFSETKTASILKDATEALEASLGDSSESSETLGRLAECYMVRADLAESPEERATELTKAHDAIGRLQKVLTPKDEIMASTYVALAYASADQLDLTRNEARRQKYARRVLENIEKARDFDIDASARVGLSLLEARTRHLTGGDIAEAIAALERAKNDAASVVLRREIARASAFLLVSSPQKNLVGALEKIDEVDRLYGAAEAKKNPEAACVCALDVARLCCRAKDFERARVAASRSLRFSCTDVGARLLLSGEKDLIDAATKAVDAAADLGVDAVSACLLATYADELKRSGAWFWLPAKDAHEKERGLPLEGLELLRFAEAKRGMRRLQSLGPLLLGRLDANRVPEAVVEAATVARAALSAPREKTSQSIVHERAPRMAPPPVPLAHCRHVVEAGDLSELPEEVPTLLRHSASRVAGDADRSTQTSTCRVFAKSLIDSSGEEEEAGSSKKKSPSSSSSGRKNNNNNLLLALLGASLRVTEYSDLLEFYRMNSDTRERDEAIMSWSLVGLSKIVAVCVYSCAEDELRFGVFVGPWESGRELGEVLGIEALINGLPPAIKKLAMVTDFALPDFSSLAKKKTSSSSSEEELELLSDIYDIRYASSIATLLAMEKRRRVSPSRGPRRYGISLRPKVSPASVALYDVAARAGWTCGGAAAMDIVDPLLLRGGGGGDATGPFLVRRADGVLISSSSSEDVCQQFVDDELIFGGSAAVLSSAVTMTQVDVLLCAGAGTVVAPLWDPVDDRGILLRALFFLVFWRKAAADVNRCLDAPLKEAQSWLQQATLREARDLVTDVVTDPDDRFRFQKIFRDAYGPETGNVDSRRLSSSGTFAFVCFGHAGKALPVMHNKKETFPRTTRLFSGGGDKRKTQRPDGDEYVKEMPTASRRRSSGGERLLLGLPYVFRRRSSDASAATSGDGETVATRTLEEEEEEEDDDDLLDPEARAWIAYCETAEGRLRIEEVGVDRALRSWTLERRKNFAAYAAREALRRSQEKALSLAKATKTGALEVFQSKVDTDYLRKTKKEAATCATVLAQMPRRRFHQHGGDRALERLRRAFVQNTTLIAARARQKAQQLANTETFRTVADSAPVAYSRRGARAVATQSARTAKKARATFRDRGGDAAIDKAKHHLVQKTRAAVQAARRRTLRCSFAPPNSSPNRRAKETTKTTE